MSKKGKKAEKKSASNGCRCSICGELIDLDGNHHGPKAGPDADAGLDALDRHIAKHWGQPELVINEIVPSWPPVELHIVPASEDRPFYTVITKGMSDCPMEIPEGMGDEKFVELVMCLPQGWPYDRDSLRDPRVFWPFKYLGKLAKVTHQDGGWVGCPCMYPFPAGGYEFADDVNFTTFLFAPPVLAFRNGAWQADVGEGKTVTFLGVIPICESEARYGESHGSGRLLLKLWEAGVNELLDKNRPAVV